MSICLSASITYACLIIIEIYGMVFSFVYSFANTEPFPD